MTVGLSTGEQYEDPVDHLLSSYKGSSNKSSESSPEPSSEIEVNRDYKVPYISGPSNDGKTVYVDKSVPKTATLSGQTFDTAEPLKIHELVEKAALEHYLSQGMDDQAAYKKAHEDHAEPAENAWYMAHGIDPKEADKWWSRIDQHTEQEGTEGHPSDLFKAPYPHHKVEGDPAATHGIDDPRIGKARNIINNLGAATAFYPNLLIQSAIEGFKAPGDVFREAYEGHPPSDEEMFQKAQAVTGLITQGGISRVASGTAESGLGLIGGVGSARAPLGQLRMAEHLESAGKTEREIHSLTGWERGAEDKWKFEISDRNAELKFPISNDPALEGHTFKMSDLVEHSELYEHYPQMRDFPIQIENNPQGPYKAYHDGQKIVLNMAHDDGSKIGWMQTILHETQHHIQEMEGFARGAGFATAMSPALKTFVNPELEEGYRTLQNNAMKVLNKKALEVTPDEWTLLTKARKAREIMSQMRNAAEQWGRENYHRTAGEQEARNVEYRFLNEKQRQLETLSKQSSEPWTIEPSFTGDPVFNPREIRPSQTETVPREHQIVLDKPVQYSPLGPGGEGR